jgi:oligogalacturonide lyase
MKQKIYLFFAISFLLTMASTNRVYSQIGKRFPSEKKVVIDPVTGTPLTFLTSTPNGDSKMYQTHPQWTSDNQWLVFRSNRVRGEVMAVNEKSGDIVQVTEGGYTGMICLARKVMKMFILRNAPAASANAPAAPQRRFGGALQVVEVNIGAVPER